MPRRPTEAPSSPSLAREVHHEQSRKSSGEESHRRQRRRRKEARPQQRIHKDTLVSEFERDAQFKGRSRSRSQEKKMPRSPEVSALIDPNNGLVVSNPVESSTNTLLLVKILSNKVHSTSLTIPVSLVVQRELEMEAAAQSFGITQDRWSGSLLYNQWNKQGRTEWTLDPETDCSIRNFSHTLVWHEWLTNVIQQYYNTGKLQIPDHCQGSEILLALEYFGILYQPDQLVFDSYLAYSRVKLWSDYFTHRSVVADWVTEKVLQMPQYHYSFGTTPDPTEGHMEIGHRRLVVLDGGDSAGARFGSQSSAALLYNFFNASDDIKCAMRQDFCLYLQNILTDIEVSFPVKSVTVRSPQNTVRQEQRAVLMIDVLVPPTTPQRKKGSASSTLTSPSSLKGRRNKSDLSAPLDEIVEDDMAAGKLDNLLKEVDGRNSDVGADTGASPRSAVENIYRGLESSKNADVRAPKMRYHFKSDKKPQQQERVVKIEKLAVKESISDLTPAQQPQEISNIKTPIDPPKSAKLYLEPNFAATSSDDKPASIDVINEDGASVASTLTGPFFLDGGRLRDVHGAEEDIRAQALRQEWIQGSLLNRDISKRVRALLMTDDNAEKEKNEAQKANDPDSAWSWMDFICRVPEGWTMENSPCDDAKESAQIDSVKHGVMYAVENSDLFLCNDDGEKEVPSQFGTPSPVKDEEPKVIEPKAASKNSEGLVKNRISQYHEAIVQQSRQDSGDVFKHASKCRSKESARDSRSSLDARPDISSTAAQQSPDSMESTASPSNASSNSAERMAPQKKTNHIRLPKVKQATSGFRKLFRRKKAEV